MDQKSEVIDEKKKLVLEKELTNYLFEAAKKNEITRADIKYIAEEILEDFKKIKNQVELVLFLETISKKWTFFSYLLIKYKGVSERVEEKKVIDKLSSYLKNQS